MPATFMFVEITLAKRRLGLTGVQLDPDDRMGEIGEGLPCYSEKRSNKAPRRCCCRCSRPSNGRFDTCHALTTCPHITPRWLDLLAQQYIVL